jgi:hypothetical protein
MRRGKLIIVILFALLAPLAVQPASAQRRGSGGPANPPRARQGGNPRRNANGRRPAQHPANPGARNPNAAKPNAANEGAGPNKGGANGQETNRQLAGLPPKWVQNLRDRSPQEQEQFMRNNQQFRNLPPQRQAQIRQNLAKWNRLSPTEQNAIRDRQRILEQMTPEQRQHYQNDILPKWQQMAPARRQLITGRLHILQGMTPSQREAALNDPRFVRGLTPDEQSTLRDLNSLSNP